MAGDWIPLEVNMPRKPKVLRIARITGRKRPEVAGLLLDFWAWASNQTTDGILPDMDITDMVLAITDTDEAFWLAVVEVGWLEVHPDRLVIPRVDEWISRGAKARLLKNVRQARWRGNVDAPVDARPSTDAPTTEQNRTEELGDESPKTPLARSLPKRQPSEPETSEQENPADQQDRQTEAFGPTPASMRESRPCTDASEMAAGENPAIVFPVVGRGSHEWTLPVSLIPEFQTAYPHLDIMAEMRAARIWCITNRARRKTPKGMPKFLNNWLTNVQNGVYKSAAGSAAPVNGIDRPQPKETTDSKIRRLRGEKPKQEGTP